MESPIAVFDLDGVLTSRDTMAYLCRLALRGHPGRLIQVAAVLAARTLLHTQGVRQKADRVMVAIALTKCSDPRYRHRMQETVQQFISRGWVRDDLIEALRIAGRRGRVDVATASEEALARQLLDALGAADVEVIGSRLPTTGRGLRMGLHNVGHQKLATLTSCGVSLAAATFYTDSSSDLPVAEACACTVYVAGNLRDFRRFRDAARWGGLRNPRRGRAAAGRW